jgi:hypothetical protein
LFLLFSLRGDGRELGKGSEQEAEEQTCLGGIMVAFAKATIEPSGVFQWDSNACSMTTQS